VGISTNTMTHRKVLVKERSNIKSTSCNSIPVTLPLRVTFSIGVSLSLIGSLEYIKGDIFSIINKIGGNPLSGY